MNKNIVQRVASLQLQGKNGYEQDYLRIMNGDMDVIEQWSLPLTAQERLDRNNAIFDHWLAGETTTEIAKKSHLDRSAIDDVVANGRVSKVQQHSPTEQPPIYNVWNYGSCDPRFGQKHPGQMPGQALVNLLLWLTKPFAVVVDPMAGGGTTADVCRYLLRRYHCLDIDPKRTDIKKWDIRDGYPRLPQRPNFILLDPPYWRLKREEYSKDGSALGSYDGWLVFMRKLAKDTHKALKDGGYAALLIESFLDERETGRFLFLNRDCLNLFEGCGFEGIQEIALNMPSQIKSFRDVTYAKEHGILLDLKREIFVFKKPCKGRGKK